MRQTMFAALAATILVSATPVTAQVATVNGTSLSTAGGTDSTTIYFGGPAGTTATSSLYLQLTGANATTGDYTFHYIFTNTNASVSNLVNFAFAADPTLLNVTNFSGMNFYLVNKAFGFTVDACAGPTGNNNCSDASGQADGFSGNFTLDFAGGTEAITLDDFFVRYASLNQLPNSPSGEGVPTGVPEPATWAMMLLGFGGIGMAMRRKQKRTGALMQVA